MFEKVVHQNSLAPLLLVVYFQFCDVIAVVITRTTGMTCKKFRSGTARWKAASHTLGAHPWSSMNQFATLQHMSTRASLIVFYVSVCNCNEKRKAEATYINAPTNNMLSNKRYACQCSSPHTGLSCYRLFMYLWKLRTGSYPHHITLTIFSIEVTQDWKYQAGIVNSI